ncbi:MAG: AlpA family phage regulatory protein [Pandoraea sp.]|uniref:AlpA family transcriptional regulator n=2 Tax=Trinickia dabaoshanensis TaxID=564714 RepID=A0A2N7VI24_9BURK|nr:MULTISPECIES: AlpA family phage regulatory protein [Burkholderiaceae]PMS16802.1 AlpA family transcriptional regulator [Trinickia dabaoshanensis]TAM18598.1 MAG: AlpA family phage regulatory protein [Pandoraea sp.]TAM55340.1 MAG: AlpA family phage regulatory protein [Paraburkholderia sp.]
MSWNGNGALTILRRRQVEQCTGLSRSTIYKRMRDGTFPPAIPLGGRLVGWRSGDIERFLSDPARYRASQRAQETKEKGGDGETR